MDVDNELDGTLLHQFSAMGTNDKEVLVAEFHKLLGNQLNQSGCEFFLEMNKWYFNSFQYIGVSVVSMSHEYDDITQYVTVCM